MLALTLLLALQEPPPPPPAPAEDTAAAPTSDAPAADPETPTPDAHAPAALAADPEPPAPAPAPAATADDKPPERRVGDPMPYTRREPLTNALGFQFGIRYGLVGTGPTRFVDDIRFGVTDWLELRTALLPYPSSLMARLGFGKQQGEMGILMVDAGLAHFDAGFRIVPDTGESAVGIRFHLEGGVAYAKALSTNLSVYSQVHYRYRLSFLPDDDQHAVAGDVKVFYDLTGALAVGAGLGAATTIVTPVRELGINFVETDQPGMSHLIARDEGDFWSITVPITLTYGRVENFDVDLFCTPRIFPELGVLLGAGVRLRLDPFTGG